MAKDYMREFSPLVEVQAIVRGTALLPCDIEPPAPNDSVILAIWFKNEMTPFYRVAATRNATDGRAGVAALGRGGGGAGSQVDSSGMDASRGSGRRRVWWRAVDVYGGVRVDVAALEDGGSARAWTFIAGQTPNYDARGRASESASHWRDKAILGERGYFRTVTTPATLSLSEISERDEGVYRCRVDFRQSPSRNTRLNLTVVVPPQRPTIFDELGRELVDRAGPYEEGGQMRLTCIVTGGRPPPTVLWWRGERLLDALELPSSSSFPNVRKSQLVVPRLRRADLGAIFTCQAANNNISQPAQASVSLDLNFRPLSASILSSEQPLSAGRSYELTCRSVGSRPPARISWWLDSTMLQGAAESVTSDGNETISRLQLTPAPADHDKMLTCRAENPQLPAAVEEDSWRLNIFYVPQTELRLGANLNPNDIEEGDDVYFECEVNANPSAYKVMWKHNGAPLHHSTSDGIIVSTHNLALQMVSKHQAGNYTCSASNIEGDGASNTVQLRVMYKPVCRPGLQRVYAVARHEVARVQCRVDAFPLPDAFRWSFNNSAESVEVPPHRFNSSATASVLAYTPVAEMDYGTVLCWADNTAGRQPHPCVFHVIPAGIPEPPFNCSVANQTSDTVHVRCLEGFDGGQPQLFVLEVADVAGGLVLANLSSRAPLFTVDGLAPGQALRLSVYAANSKGRSDAVHFEGATLKAAEKQTGPPDQLEMSPLLGVLLGLVLVLVVVTAVVVGTLRARFKRRRIPRPGDLAFKEKAAALFAPARHDRHDKDEINPDVIPSNSVAETAQDSCAQTPAADAETEEAGLLPATPAQPPPPGGPVAHAALVAEQRMQLTSNGQPPPTRRDVWDCQGPGVDSPTEPALPVAAFAPERPSALPSRLPPLVGSATLPRRTPAAAPAPTPPLSPPAPAPALPPRQVPAPPSVASVLASPVTPTGCGHPLREIVTVRTPLMAAAHQESCV
ncbi:nephrin-like [Schistocerca cancellata]|uniref:nephrin-like n=1 Tax=Schistocerca cancellata TaxID=274614 RepID=UPI002117A489|nr:nephrin-like [Schistocerca cancellata]